MNEQRVRQGEWNEALCFWEDEHPKTEIAAQFCRDHWNVWYISNRFFVVFGGIKDQEIAETVARNVARDVLNSPNPVKRAEEINRMGGMEWYK